MTEPPDSGDEAAAALVMHDNGAVVDGRGVMLVRLVYADRELREYLFERIRERVAGKGGQASTLVALDAGLEAYELRIADLEAKLATLAEANTKLRGRLDRARAVVATYPISDSRAPRGQGCPAARVRAVQPRAALEVHENHARRRAHVREAPEPASRDLAGATNVRARRY